MRTSASLAPFVVFLALTSGCFLSSDTEPESPRSPPEIPPVPLPEPTVECNDGFCDDGQLCLVSCWGSEQCIDAPSDWEGSPTSCSTTESDPCQTYGSGSCGTITGDTVSCFCAIPRPEPEVCSPSASEEPPRGDCECGFEWLPHPEAGNCYACLDCPTCEAPTPPDSPDVNAGASVVWQMQGGFAGTGPTAIVTGDGMLTIYWQDASDPSPDFQVEAGVDATNTFFALLGAVDFDAIPHDINRDECDVQLRIQSSEDLPARTISYGESRQVMPELYCVTKWIGGRLPDDSSRPWRAGCSF